MPQSMNNPIKVKTLQMFNMFEKFNEDQLEALIKHAEIVMYNVDDTVIAEDSESNALYFITSGKVLVSKNQVPLAELKAGDHFGEMALFSDNSVTATISAVEPTTIISIPHNTFNLFFKSSPDILNTVIETLVNRLKNENSKVVDQYIELQQKYVELKDAHKQLIQTEKLASIGMLTAGIAHEVNNPLAVVMLYLELLEENYQKDKTYPEDYENQIGSMKRASEAIKNIVMELKNFVHMDDSVNNDIILNDVVGGSINLVGYLCKKEQITIDTKFTESNPVIKGNVGKLQQVVMNLVSNAKDAMEGRKNKKITLITEDSGTDQVIVKVADTGSGIPEDKLAKIFDKFFTTKPVGKGTGLGLDIIKTIVEEMQGKIEVESELEVGTTFCITFPRVKEN